MTKMGKRLGYLLAFWLLTVLEVCIALFFQAGFVRAYLGDVVVIWVLYCLARVFLPEGCRLLPFLLFLFSTTVEFLQAIGIVDLLGISNPFLRTLIGTSFSWWDILCYATGCAVLLLWEWIIYGKRKSLHFSH